MPVLLPRYGVCNCQGSQNSQRADGDEKETQIEVGVHDAGEGEDKTQID